LPTRRLLWLALGLAVPIALATLHPVFLLLAALALLALAGAVVLDVRMGPNAGSFTVARQHEPRLSLGEPNPVTLAVSWRTVPFGQRLGALQLWARDEAPPAIPVDRRTLEGAIAPGGEWLGRYHLHPDRRGDYRFGDAFLRARMPLGLVVRQFRYRLSGPVHVYPNLLAIRRYDLLASRSRLHELGLRRSRMLGQGTEFERLREYQPDDEYRRINWKATARRHQPMTVAYETERSQNLMLLIDTGRLMSTPAGALDKLDHAVNAALLLAYVAIKLGDRVGLLVFADTVRQYIPPGRGQPQFHLILDSLYKVRPEQVEPDPARAIAYLAARQSRRSLAILFTDLVEATEADSLVASLGLLARRHLALCVTLSDPDIVALAARLPDDSRAAYEKVLAGRLLDERRAILQRLERSGVLTLDVPAEQLTAEAVNRYLDAKARALL
jgi:uncharacterized protein (DUF58 family)